MKTVLATRQGVKAFAAALMSGCGALPTLKELYVDDGDHSQLVAACEARSAYHDSYCEPRSHA